MGTVLVIFENRSVMTRRCSIFRAVQMNRQIISMDSYDSGSSAGNSWSFVTFFLHLSRLRARYGHFFWFHSSWMIIVVSGCLSFSYSTGSSLWMTGQQGVMVCVQDPFLQCVRRYNLDSFVALAYKEAVVGDFESLNHPLVTFAAYFGAEGIVMLSIRRSSTPIASKVEDSGWGSYMRAYS